MPYVGRTPSAVPVTADDIPANSIDASKIVDGAITIADIADDAVTAAKLANSINTEIAANTAKTGITSGQASAITANTAKVTNATHTGDVTGATALTIADNAVTLAKMAGGTDGQIITYDASGNPVTVGPGTDGQVLTSTGAGSPPAFETAAGGGKVLQVVSSGGFSATASTSSTSWVDTGQSVTITPASGSKVLLMLNGGGGRPNRPIGYPDARVVTTLYRGSTNLGHSSFGLAQQRIKAEVSSTSGGMVAPHSIIHLDASPGGDGSTAITYKIYYKSPDACTVNYSYVTDGRVELVAMEIGA